MALKANHLAKARARLAHRPRNLDRINGVILNMLAFSKHRQPLLENVNVNTCRQRMRWTWSAPRPTRSGVAILTDLGDLPPIPADADGLHQAFLNLLTNALDAVPDKTGVITVGQPVRLHEPPGPS